MENKPIRRNPHIVKLSKDHHTTLLFCWKIRNGLKFNVEPERIKKYVQYFWTEHMLPHFRLEEESLFSLLQDELVEKALQDHRAISTLVKRIETETATGESTLPAIADLVDAHVRYEERILFPHLEKSLSEPELAEAGKQLAAQEEKKDDFPDAFWAR